MFLEYKPEVEHVILGDLMDSRDYGVTLDDELECLELVLSSNAVLLWGNHDLAYTDKPCWEPYARFKDTYAPISELIIPHQNRFKTAHAIDGWLCTHAGISTKLAKYLPDMPLDSGAPEMVAPGSTMNFSDNGLFPGRKSAGSSIMVLVRCSPYTGPEEAMINMAVFSGMILSGNWQSRTRG
jgi:hypothetical protein